MQKMFNFFGNLALLKSQKKCILIKDTSDYYHNSPTLSIYVIFSTVDTKNKTEKYERQNFFKGILIIIHYSS